MIVTVSDSEIWRGPNFYIQSAGLLSKYIRCYADRHRALSKKEFLDLVSKVKGENEKSE